jgi:hypothetical protein
MPTDEHGDHDDRDAVRQTLADVPEDDVEDDEDPDAEDAEEVEGDD